MSACYIKADVAEIKQQQAPITALLSPVKDVSTRMKINQVVREYCIHTAQDGQPIKDSTQSREAQEAQRKLGGSKLHCAQPLRPKCRLCLVRPISRSQR